MNFESIIQNLSSPVKNKTLRNINHSVNDILTNTSCDSCYQAKVCNSFLQKFKKLNLDKKYKEVGGYFVSKMAISKIEHENTEIY